MNPDEILAVLRAHQCGHEWWDTIEDRMQWLCGCREWVYDHPQHVADELIKQEQFGTRLGLYD